MKHVMIYDDETNKLISDFQLEFTENLNDYEQELVRYGIVYIASQLTKAINDGVRLKLQIVNIETEVIIDSGNIDDLTSFLNIVKKEMGL